MKMPQELLNVRARALKSDLGQTYKGESLSEMMQSPTSLPLPGGVREDLPASLRCSWSLVTPPSQGLYVGAQEGGGDGSPCSLFHRPSRWASVKATCCGAEPQAGVSSNP